ncbi:uncharacterized protein B0H18DRAFT_1130419 [Fomitopsis serialis]|uniref:uncharacterized protein n=1 Tax=Fomitopsis serialis TaxID=139415 RepID=UPI0020078DEE|nr:uncharacterized protein B0H18DRAFT_1130419 [Neoantrodia serialis]KAH9910271.1 hypothetical protein B0H18DRAFT_1130419 [Neoantrodia serialis]
MGNLLSTDTDVASSSLVRTSLMRRESTVSDLVPGAYKPRTQDGLGENPPHFGLDLQDSVDSILGPVPGAYRPKTWVTRLPSDVSMQRIHLAQEAFVKALSKRPSKRLRVSATDEEACASLYSPSNFAELVSTQEQGHSFTVATTSAAPRGGRLASITGDYIALMSP